MNAIGPQNAVTMPVKNNADPNHERPNHDRRTNQLSACKFTGLPISLAGQQLDKNFDNDYHSCKVVRR
jgi:hypothetical protein